MGLAATLAVNAADEQGKRVLSVSRKPLSFAPEDEPGVIAVRTTGRLFMLDIRPQGLVALDRLVPTNYYQILVS